jgi:hypothetical protein
MPKVIHLSESDDENLMFYSVDDSLFRLDSRVVWVVGCWGEEDLDDASKMLRIGFPYDKVMYIEDRDYEYKPRERTKTDDVEVAPPKHKLKMEELARKKRWEMERRMDDMFKDKVDRLESNLRPNNAKSRDFSDLFKK